MNLKALWSPGINHRMPTTTKVAIRRCAECGYMSIQPAVMNQHRRRGRRCADAAVEIGTAEATFDGPAVVPTRPSPPGPKPRDYGAYFACRAGVWDVSRRHFNADLVRTMDPTTANLTALPARIFRTLWGAGAPDELRSILAGPNEYVYVVGDGAGVVKDTKRRSFRVRMARFILETFADDITGALGNDDLVPEFLQELAHARLSTVGDMILTHLSLEFNTLAPTAVVAQQRGDP